jgi:hypothetical protein
MVKLWWNPFRTKELGTSFDADLPKISKAFGSKAVPMHPSEFDLGLKISDREQDSSLPGEVPRIKTVLTMVT